MGDISIDDDCQNTHTTDYYGHYYIITNGSR